MREAEAAANSGTSSLRISLCAFDVDDVGLVVEPKGLDSSSMLHRLLAELAPPSTISLYSLKAKRPV